MVWMLSDGWVYAVVLVAICWFAYRVGKAMSDGEAMRAWAEQSQKTSAQHRRIEQLKSMLGERG